MEHSPHIAEELYQVAPLLAKAGKANVFTIQDNYFDLLSNRIMNLVAATPVFRRSSSEAVFATPENYFSNFPGHLLARIKELKSEARQEIEDISPLLSSLQTINVFHLDQSYFSDFAVSTLTETPVVKMQPFNRFWKFASAAAIAGVMATSALLIENTQQTDGTGSIASELRLAKTYKTNEQINNAIQDLTADDIVNYLDQSGTAADETDLANSITDKELPSSEDYLLDENTLSDYLNEIKLRSANN